MKTAFYGYRSDIAGLFWLAMALFFSLALSSYHPLDPSFNSAGVIAEVKNKCGYIGSFLADGLYQVFGLGAWVFVLLVLRRSALAFQRKSFLKGENSTPYNNVSPGKIFRKGGGLNQGDKGIEPPPSFFWSFGLTLMALLVCSALLELHQSEKQFFDGYISAGGLAGKFIIQSTKPYLKTAGHVLVFWPLALMLFVSITKSSVSDILMKVFFILKEKGLHLVLLFANVIFRALIKAKNVCVFYLKKLPLPLAVLKDRQTDSEFPNISQEKDYFFKESPSPLKNNNSFEEESSEPSFLTNEDSPTPFPAVDKGWKLPSTSLLEEGFSHNQKPSLQENQKDAERLQKKLDQFSISGKITHIRSGPVITVFEFKPEDHIKVARITQMEDDLMIALKSKSIRIIAPIPGRDVVGIETAHTKRQIVYLKYLLEDSGFEKAPSLPLLLGRHVDGRLAMENLAKIPHLMVAGSTGSGKSVFVVSFLLSLLFRHTPDTLRMVLVDPKRVDLNVFEGLPHLLSPPVRESKEAAQALGWCLNEMQKRYRSLARFQVRDLEGFNQAVKKLNTEELKKHEELSAEMKEEDYYFTPLPYICIVLEEFGDLMGSPERSRIESSVVRLAQMARACGMHLILSMQSPRKDVVTGLIKTNIPGRISFKVSSRVDSRIILDEGGAERLLSQGDMLYLAPGRAKPERCHAPFVTESEAREVVQFWKNQAKGDYVIKLTGPADPFLRSGGGDEVFQDDQKYEEIFSYVSELKEVSASHLQRKYGLGYPRAARLIDRLEEEGVIGPARGSKPREVLDTK